MLKNRISKILALTMLPASLLAFEVDFNKKFTKELMPDTLSANITIRIDGDMEKDISKKLSKFNEEIKDNDEVQKKLGSYTIRPNYKYSSNNVPKILGYVGELRYTINSTEAKLINEFISDINALKKSRDTSISISNLSWKVKDETYNIALDILRLQAISWAQRYSANLSQDIRKQCVLKNVVINAHHNHFPRVAKYSMERVASSQSSVPVPQANEQKITINPSYKLECR